MPSIVGGTTHSAKDDRNCISLSVIDLLPMRRLDERSLPSILRSKLLTALLNNDVSGKVNARGLRESFGQIWRDADVFRVSGSAERRPCLAKFYCDDIALRHDACVVGPENWSQQSPVSDDEQVIKPF